MHLQRGRNLWKTFILLSPSVRSTNPLFWCAWTRNTFVPAMPALTRCVTGSKLQGVWKKKEKLQVSQRKRSQVGTLNDNDSFGIPHLCARVNTLQHILTKLEVLEKKTITYLKNAEYATIDDITNGLGNKFELSLDSSLEGIHQLCEAVAYKLIFHDLSHVFWDGLYVGEPTSARIQPMLNELEQNLETISEIVHNKVHASVITNIMKASFDGFLLIILVGDPSRVFSQQDSQIIEEDFRFLKDLYWSNGDGLSDDLIDRYSKTVREILPLFRTDTESLIERFQRLTIEMYVPSTKSRFPLPPTSRQWSSTERNTFLCILCYLNDEAATKFLKRTYNFPKKL